MRIRRRPAKCEIADAVANPRFPERGCDGDAGFRGVAGYSSEEAKLAALRAFGGVELAKE